MVKSYLHSFIAMKYIFILPILGISIFLLAFAFFSTRNNIFRIIAIVIGAILLVLLILFYGERATLSRKLKKFDHWQEYNDSYIIGQAFLLEERMLVYDRKIHEFYYKDLRNVRAEEAKGDRQRLYFSSDKDQAMDLCSSVNQAKRFCAMLKKRNPAITFTGIEPEGDGIIANVESGHAETTI